MSVVANPFDRSELFIAAEYHPAITATVDRADENKAFRRQVDAWWLALAIGVQRDQRRQFSGERIKFIDGIIFGSDPWRITHLQLLGLLWFGADALDRPGDIITAANEYANAGFDWIADTADGAGNRTLAIYNRIEDLLVEGATAPGIDQALG
jgi:hypothetical protein